MLSGEEPQQGKATCDEQGGAEEEPQQGQATGDGLECRGSAQTVGRCVGSGTCCVARMNVCSSISSSDLCELM